MSNNKDNSHAIVFAGPNGSGKTSLISEVEQNGLSTRLCAFPMPKLFINPDQVNKDLQGSFASLDERNKAAFDKAIDMRTDAVLSGETFAFETVMSHPSRISEMLLLKQNQYTLVVTYIATDDPDINVARVKMRVKHGTTTGHDVEERKIRDRYDRAMALLPKAAEIADYVFVFDNTAEYIKGRATGPALQAVISRSEGEFSVVQTAKPWVERYLVTPLREREIERNQLLHQLEDEGHELAVTDELNGAYRGIVLLASDNYLAQQDASNQTAILHDRSLLDAVQNIRGEDVSYAPREELTITYSLQQGVHIERHPRTENGSAEDPTAETV